MDNLALNILTKWRRFFAAWQIGFRPLGNPQADAIADHREMSMLMRSELSALTNLLIARGVFTPDEFREALDIEAAALSKSYEQRFPGFTSTAQGISIDVPKAQETLRKTGYFRETP